MTVLLGGTDEMFLDRPQDSSVLADVEVLIVNILRCCLKEVDMITGARLSWWVIGLAKYPPTLAGSSSSLASEQTLALWRWKSLKISKPL